MAYPVDAALPRLARALEANRAVILVAPPGSGKTTRAAPYLLDLAPGWLGGRKIVLLEPRRLAARMAAGFMSRQRGGSVGGEIGYRIRLENRTSAQTRIEILTEGLLTQRLLADPELADTACILFDEFHERSLAADTGLALALELRAALRPDLRLVVMSATLDAAELAQHLPDSEVIEAQGRMFPVETRYAPAFAAQDASFCNPAAVARAVRRALASEPGSVLAFLPGEGEIRRTEERLREEPLPPGVDLFPLYGALGKTEQDAAVAPSPPGRRKVVLATSIAETSLTIEGVTVVVDSGWMRVPRFSPATGMSRLDTVRVTRDRADQRRGRAGRTTPGVCYRLWDEAEDRRLAETQSPEILDADLAPLALQCAEWGTTRRDGLPWLTPPPDASWRRACSLLEDLGAIHGGAITPRGRRMVRFPVHPRLAEMIVRAAENGCPRRACFLAACVEEAQTEPGLKREPDVGRVTARAAAGKDGFARRVNELAARWSRRFEAADARRLPDGLILAWAFPDRIARRRDNAGRFLLRNGRGAVLDTLSPLASETWLVCLDLQDAGADAKIRLAAPLDERDVLESFADELEEEVSTRWDKREEAVAAVKRTKLGAIVLREGAQPDADAESVKEALFEGIRQKGIDQLPWSKGALALRERVCFLHRALPEQGWPDFSDAGLAASLPEWLGPFCDGVKRWSRLAEIDLPTALLCRLRECGCSRKALDRLAPTHLPVPSGSNITVRYDAETPYLAVRIQEVFGMRETPRIAGGKVAVVMHLLSPAHRPVQVTADLESFWRESYAYVRKDLRGRYPKHDWPEDPTQGIASRRGRNGK